jgi:putative transposase
MSLIIAGPTELHRTKSVTQPMSRPPFIPFDDQRAVRIYRRSLPHWRQEGATYFVTFRLGDSIPGDIARAWDDERRRWIAARVPDFDLQHGRVDTAVGRLSPEDQFRFHKHFNGRMQDYLDRGVGECHLRESDCLSVVRRQILSGDGDSYHVGDFTIMPNHVHLLVMPRAAIELEGVLRSIKGASSRNCNLALGRPGQFWQPESYDHIVRSLEQLLAYREYIAENPQKAGVIVAAEALYRAEWMDDWFHRGTDVSP